MKRNRFSIAAAGATVVLAACSSTPERIPELDAAQQIHQNLNSPIIFTTGDTAPAALRRMFEDRPSAILKKPFSVDELKRAIRSALRQAAEEGTEEPG